MINSMLTRNTDQLRQKVEAHVAADTIIQGGSYWNNRTQSGCFIGCLAKCNDPMVNEITYGLPVMLQRIAESIFEALPAANAKAFFAALPEAVDCDGKDLTKVSWQFLAANLRQLPNCPAQIQAAIDSVITGMDLLASGQEWVDAAAAAWVDANANAADDAWVDANAAAVSSAAARYAAEAVHAAANAANAVFSDDVAADDAASSAAYLVAKAVAADSAAAAWVDFANAAHVYKVYDADYDAVRLRQRNLLLQLISEAPVVKAY